MLAGRTIVLNLLHPESFVYMNISVKVLSPKYEGPLVYFTYRRLELPLFTETKK